MSKREQLTRWLWRATSVAWLVLAITGVVLLFVYKPAPAGIWDGSLDTEGGPATLTRVHLVAAMASIVLPILQAMNYAIDKLLIRAVQTAGLFVLTIFAWFSGSLLPWDQLALWAVTVGTDIDGYQPVFSDDVRFLLIDGREVSKQSIRLWLGIHVIAVPLIAIAGTALARKRSTTNSTDSNTPQVRTSVG